VINVNLKDQTSQVLRTLTPREEKVIKMRFGLEDGSEHTLEEVGQSFAVTRERIRQIEAKALRKLRHPSRSRKLRAFLDGVARLAASQGFHGSYELRHGSVSCLFLFPISISIANISECLQLTSKCENTIMPAG